MKKLLVALMLLSCTGFAQQKPVVAFKVSEKDIIPEGITYDPVGKAFYLSSIYKNKILKISATGVVTDFIKSGQDEFLEGLGMKVDASGNLWACNNTPEHDTLRKVSNVHVFNLKTSRFVKKFQLNDGKRHLFNDLYFTSSGDTYVTDSEGGGVYLIKNGSDKIEEFISPGKLYYPNGLSGSADDSHLFVSTASGLGVVKVDLKTKEFAGLEAKFRVIGLDGLYRYKNRLIGVQNAFFPEAVLQLTLSTDNKTIEKIDFLSQGDPSYDIPTTGVIVGDEFYFIGNSQLFQLIGNQGKIKNPEKLKETLIMKIKLN